MRCARCHGLLLSGLMACAGVVGEDPPGDPGEPGEDGGFPPGVIGVQAADSLLVAADPKLDGFGVWPLAFDSGRDGRDDLMCRISLSRDAVVLATFEAVDCVAAWDGKGPAGEWLSPGPVTAAAALLADGEVLADTTVELDVLRLGVSEIGLAAEPVGARVALLYPETGGALGGFHEVPATQAPWRLGALDDPNGAPRAAPAPWEDLKSPPLDESAPDGVEAGTYNLPVALVAGAQVDLALTPDGVVPEGIEVRVLAPAGFEPAEAPFVPGTAVHFRSNVSPVPAVGRIQLDASWRFESRRAGGPWVSMPGAVTASHRLYGLAGEPALGYTELPHRAWVDVVDTVTTWVNGTTAEPEAVAAAIVTGVYEDLGLTYDNVGGASAYIEWGAADRSSAFFDLAQFQRRGFGNVINCADAAGIVSTYAGMVGVDLRYHILDRNDGADAFDLNYIRVIGGATFDETPFADGRGAYRYHAVVGPADGTFYDATLQLDGDGVPTAPPHTPLLAVGMSSAEYIATLSSEAPVVGVFYDQKMRLR